MDWLTTQFVQLRWHLDDSSAIFDFLVVKMASVPSSWTDELQLLTEHFLFTKESAERIISAVHRMGHTTLLQEVADLIENAWILQTSSCSSTPCQWISVHEVTNDVDPKCSDDLCIFNVPKTISGAEDKLQMALKDLWAEAASQGFGLLYHGTTWSSAVNIIRRPRLISGRPTDFVPEEFGGFYLGADWFAAREWAEGKASKYLREDPAVLIYRTEPMNELIARPDNLSLDLYDGSGQEDDWDRMVNGCRLDLPRGYSHQWMDQTEGLASISGPMAKRGGTAEEPCWQRDLDTWQLAIISHRRLFELVPAMCGVVVWGDESNT